MTTGHLNPNRPHAVAGQTVQTTTGCGNMYITVNHDDGGKITEVFIHLGKAGGCAAAQTQAIGRLACLTLSLGGTLELVTQQLAGIQCPRPRSCADAVAEVLAMVG